MSNGQAEEIYFDAETLRLSHEVEGGWSNIKSFGLAVAVTWDAQHKFREWFEEDARVLVEELERFSRIVTFNGERFDFEVLSAYAPVANLYTRSLDLLAVLHRALGHRVKLQSVARDNLCSVKGGSGLDAVRWWREGQKDKVVEYCRQDVQLLIDLLAHARQNGHLRVGDRQVRVV